MQKDRFKSTQLFLKRLFFKTPAIIVIFIFIMSGIAGYTIYQKEFKKKFTKSSMPLIEKKETIVKIAVNSANKAKQKAVITKPKVKNDDVLDTRQDSREELFAEFEERAIMETDAEKIRVESQGVDLPGYVAFMSSPAGFDQGIPEVMEDIATLYLEKFPDAPRITVSLIVSGGVKGRQTFIRDKETGVVRRGKKNMNK